MTIEECFFLLFHAIVLRPYSEPYIYRESFYLLLHHLLYSISTAEF